MGLFSIASIIRVDRVDHDGIIVPGSYLLSGIRVVCSVVLFVMYVYLLLKAPVVARRAQTALAVYATEPTDCLASPSDCHPAEETKIGKDEPREEDPDISRSRLFCGKNPRSCVLLRYAALVMQSEIWQIQISIINGTRDYIVDSIMVFANLIAGDFRHAIFSIVEIHANYVKLIIRAFVDTTMVVTDTFFGVSLRQPPPKYDWEAAVARWREKAERMPAACRDDNYCDDGDRCTTDICDKESKVCRHERVQCLCDSDKEVAECDSKTGQCMITEKKEKTTETVPEKPADVAVPDVPAEPQTAAPSPKQIRDEEFARLRAELKRMPADHKPDGYSDDVELCNAEVCYTELGTCRQALIPCSYNYITEDAYCDPTTGYCTITKKEKSDDGVVPEKTETVPAEKTIVYPPVRAVSDCVPGHDSNCESGIKYADGYVPPATVA